MNGAHLPSHSPAHSQEYLHLLAQLNTLKQEVNTLRSEVDDHTREIISFHTRTAILGTDIHLLSTDNRALRNQLNDEMLVVKEHWFMHEQQIIDLGNQADMLKGQISTDIPMLNEQIAMHKEQIDTLNYDLNALKDDASQQEVRENALKARIEAQNSRIKELEVRQDEQGVVLHVAMQMLLSRQNLAE